jgi:hypothetical protein
MSQNEEEAKVELLLGRDDWERFLSSLEKLMSLNQKTLQKLKELHHRNEALRRELRDAVGLPTDRGEPVEITQGQAEAVMKPDRLGQRVKAGLGFLGLLPRIESPSPRLPQTGSSVDTYASCEKCGYRPQRASRFCEGCGADFGTLICPCGRDLSSNDKFCDHCGRSV